MICPECERPITSEMYFCIHCGEQLQKEEYSMENPQKPLGGLGALLELQEQAQRMQDALRQITVIAVKDGVVVTVRGDQVIETVEVDGKIDSRIADAINEAIKRTQKLAAKQLIEISTQSGQKAESDS